MTPNFRIDFAPPVLPDCNYTSETILKRARELERQGWEVWLKTIFPLVFSKPMSDDHRRFWALWFSVVIRIRESQKYRRANLPIPDRFKILPHEHAILLLWGRGLGKSALLEVSSVLRAALLSSGYCLYISEIQDQADEHVGNCRILIESPESRLLEYYPGLKINPGASYKGKKLVDAKNMFITINGWVCRAGGLNTRLRGLRIGTQRPNDINVDDIDGVNDSMAVSERKLRQLVASVFGTQAYEDTTIKFGQNLITETSVASKFYTGRTDALAERSIIGGEAGGEVVNAFTRLDIDSKLREDGRIKHTIQPTSLPTWKGLDIAEAQRFLDDMGLAQFLAEYQNDFSQYRRKHVFLFDEARHVIPRSAFKEKFGVEYIPPTWNGKASADFGYSGKQGKSLSAWMFNATSPRNTDLPGHYFVHRALSFLDEEIGEQAEKVWEEFFPDPPIGKNHFEATTNFGEYPALLRALRTKQRCKRFLAKWHYDEKTDKFVATEKRRKEVEDRLPVDASEEVIALHYAARAKQDFVSIYESIAISHEKTGEQKTLARQYGLPTQKVKQFGKMAGQVEANELLEGDYTQPHPFFEDKPVLDKDGNDTGLWVLGSPYVYFVVDDDQLTAPRDDGGMKILREHLGSQRMTDEKLTEKGYMPAEPEKINSDYGDAFRMWSVDYRLAEAEELTIEEEVKRRLPANRRFDKKQKYTLEEEMSVRQEVAQVRYEVAKERGDIEDPADYANDEQEEFEGYIDPVDDASDYQDFEIDDPMD